MKLPTKLEKGDEIRVIAPSRSLSILSQETIDTALLRLSELGFKITFGKNISNSDELLSSSVEDRISDLHEAFLDKNVKAILTVIGGYSSNELLDYIDYELIKNNPKIICGFSDITVLLNSIYSQTGLVTYLGPHFSSFGMKKGLDYTQTYFLKALTQSSSYEIEPSEYYSDDLWFIDQEKRKFHRTPQLLSINSGEAEGELVGGNISSFSLLFGTKFMPDLARKIVLLEAHSEIKIQHFNRLLQSLIHQKNFHLIRGIIFGLPQIESGINQELLVKLISHKKELSGMPIIANLNFGHTTPNLTLPIGGIVKFSAGKNCVVYLNRV